VDRVLAEYATELVDGTLCGGAKGGGGGGGGGDKGGGGGGGGDGGDGGGGGGGAACHRTLRAVAVVRCIGSAAIRLDASLVVLRGAAPPHGTELWSLVDHAMAWAEEGCAAGARRRRVEELSEQVRDPLRDRPSRPLSPALSPALTPALFPALFPAPCLSNGSLTAL
jgi:hypothetical protein